MEDPKPISVAEFLAWEVRQASNHELIDGSVVALASPTKAHGRLVRRLNRAVDAAVGDRCDVYLGDMTVQIDSRNSAPRPDIVVTCDERDRRPSDETERTIRYPKLVVEVLSPSTVADDLGPKLRNYFAIPTLEEYVIVDSRMRSVIVYRRVEGQVLTTWPDAVISLTSIRCDIALDRLYDGIAVSAPK